MHPAPARVPPRRQHPVGIARPQLGPEQPRRSLRIRLPGHTRQRLAAVGMAAAKLCGSALPSCAITATATAVLLAPALRLLRLPSPLAAVVASATPVPAAPPTAAAATVEAADTTARLFDLRFFLPSRPGLPSCSQAVFFSDQLSLEVILHQKEPAAQPLCVPGAVRRYPGDRVQTVRELGRVDVVVANGSVAILQTRK